MGPPPEWAHTSALGRQCPNTTIAKYNLSWRKRFADNDTRYERFLCPAPIGHHRGVPRETCPHS
jgi:hypothetical protein